MRSSLDDALDNVFKDPEARWQQHARKQARKQATKKSRTVEYTTPDGVEGEVTVEICDDGDRHFVEISVDIPYLARKTVVSVDDDSRGGALVKAEEAFSETDYGSICLEWLADHEGGGA